MARKATGNQQRSTKATGRRKRGAGTASTARQKRSGGASSSTASRKRASASSTTASRRKRPTGGQRRKAASTASSRSRRASQAASQQRSTQRSRRTAVRGERGDAIAVLREDHDRVRKLLKQLHEADTANQRERLLAETRAEIERHTQIEEEIFYPAFRNVAQQDRDRELYHEATEEHRAASMVLNEISTSEEDDVFAARAKVLKDLVEHHAEEEETEMFPRARMLFPREEMQRLGRELTDRKRSLGRNESGGTLQAVASLVRRPFSS